jgi:hypothetical protein
MPRTKPASAQCSWRVEPKGGNANEPGSIWFFFGRTADYLLPTLPALLPHLIRNWQGPFGTLKFANLRFATDCNRL